MLLAVIPAQRPGLLKLLAGYLLEEEAYHECDAFLSEDMLGMLQPSFLLANELARARSWVSMLRASLSVARADA